MIHFPDRIKMGNRIKEISELKENWNDNGAEPFSKDVLKECRQLLNDLPYPMEIFPVADGSVQFENDSGNISFKVYADRLTLFWIDPFADTHYFSNVDRDYLIEFLKRRCRDD